MGYPAYKLIRAVNRQYPNNGFINYVDVREDTYNNDIIDEDLRDLINEAIQETYINIAKDEVYSFPTVPGQKEYVLPDDCDLRDIQEVVRRGMPRPLPPIHQGEETEGCRIYFDANGGTGTMTVQVIQFGSTYVLPECTFTPPDGKEFDKWEDDEGTQYVAGAVIEVNRDIVFSAIWRDDNGEDNEDSNGEDNGDGGNDNPIDEGGE